MPETEHRQADTDAADATGEGEGEGEVICPECETPNPATAAICSGCRQPLDPDAVEERRARRRHPTGREARRAARRAAEKALPGRRRSGDEATGGMGDRIRSRLGRKTTDLDPDVLLWEGRIPAAERVKKEVPDWTYTWVNKERLRYIAIGAAALMLLAIFIFWPDGTKVERGGGLGLTFTYGGGWRDISGDISWPGEFTLGPKIAGGDSETDLAVKRNGAVLAVVDSAPVSDTLSPESLRAKIESVRLLYQLSNDAKPGSPREVTYFGVPGYSIAGEQYVAGERRQEEVVVLALKGREAYVLMSAPASRWKEEREAMEQILRSAK